MKKRTGYIYQRAGWWVLRYRENLLENGQIVRKQLAKQLAEVKPEHVRLKRPPASIEDMAEDFLRPLNRGEANPQATQTIRQFAEDLFFPMLERQVRQSTLKGYHGRWVSQLLPRCGEIRLRDLTALSAQRVIDDVNRQNPKMKRSSLAHLKNLLSLIFDEALRLGSADAAKGNPARLVKIPRAPEGDETHSCGLREVETMLAVLPEPAATVCAVAAFAGLRRSELRGLRWEDYDGTQIMVTCSVWEGFSNEPKTKRSKSPVPVIPRLTGDTRGAQTGLRKSQERANFCEREREADEPEQRFEPANPAGAESLRHLSGIKTHSGCCSEFTQVREGW